MLNEEHHIQEAQDLDHMKGVVNLLQSAAYLTRDARGLPLIGINELRLCRLLVVPQAGDLFKDALPLQDERNLGFEQLHDDGVETDGDQGEEGSDEADGFDACVHAHLEDFEEPGALCVL